MFVVLLFLCVLLHEFGHIFTARAFGVSTPDVICCRSVACHGSARFRKAERGILRRHRGACESTWSSRSSSSCLPARNWDGQPSLDRERERRLHRSACRGQSFLALFNLIPAFPMDGGRVLRALLAARLGYVRATGVAAAIGQWVAFALGFLGLFGNPLRSSSPSSFLFAASSEAHLVAIRAMARGVPVTSAMLAKFASLTPDEHIDTAVETYRCRPARASSRWWTGWVDRLACLLATTSFAR